MAARSVSQPSAKLPQAAKQGKTSVEQALAGRRSVRQFKSEPLPLGSLSQILWAAQGITEPEAGFRTAPSAGALYPLELYAVVRKDGVGGLPEGVYRYQPKVHELALVKTGDLSADLEAATWDQEIVKGAAATLVITGMPSRIVQKYGKRGTQYMYQESGHVAQNVFLQATALGIGTVAMGAFSEGAVRRVIGTGAGERPLYLQPLGMPV